MASMNLRLAGSICLKAGAIKPSASCTDICVSESSVDIASKNVWIMLTSLLTRLGSFRPCKYTCTVCTVLKTSYHQLADGHVTRASELLVFLLLVDKPGQGGQDHGADGTESLLRAVVDDLVDELHSHHLQLGVRVA